MKKLLVIFGGSDYEELATREVLKQLGIATATATLNGVKVHAGNAYLANGFVLDSEDTNLSEIDGVVIFECSPVVAEGFQVVLRADHHNPGDAGYGLSPDKFWSASSLGQLCQFLELDTTEELLMVAAGDHCPADAYAGRCPSVNPETFGVFRITQKLASPLYQKNEKKNTAEKLAFIIEVAKEALRNAPEVDGVRDLREAFIDELPEAALSLGLAYMASLPDTDRDSKPTGNIKIVLGGHTTPEAVTKFMEWGNALPNKIGNAYGNPTRGFAGVIVIPEEWLWKDSHIVLWG